MLHRRGVDKMYKNSEGYADPTPGEAMRSAGRLPRPVWEVICVLRNVASLAGFEIVGQIGLKDKETGRIWKG